MKYRIINTSLILSTTYYHIMTKINLFLFSLLLLFSSCSSSKKIIGHIENQGYIQTVFPENTKNADASIAYSETSAVAFFDNQFLFANDKQTLDYSPVFEVEFDEKYNNKSSKEVQNNIFKTAVKYEDFAVSPSGNEIFLITGFDRVAENSDKKDKYNTLFYWTKSNPTPQLVLFEADTKATSSVSLRSSFLQKLQAKYFKIEGLAVLPGNKILFGIREVGASYADFQYSLKILETNYSFDKNGQIILSNDFSLFYEFDTKNSNINETLGISSLEYNPNNKSLYILTSYETENEEIGAYLWKLKIEPKLKKRPQLVYNKNKEILQFNHKAEGMTFINEKEMLIICDDDKQLIQLEGEKQRKENEAYYYYLGL